MPVPVFYSGGELSPLPELPCQKDSALERVQYVAEVNQLKKRFDGLSEENKDEWEDPIWGVPGDRVEKIPDYFSNHLRSFILLLPGLPS